MAEPPTSPVDPGSPEIQPQGGVAGGLPAVAATAAYALRAAGVVRTVRTLLAVNQKDGFDCPSCAWPDPAERAAIEFCENGAKAVADEATTARVDPDFFREHSVTRLLEESDHWLNAQGRITHPMVLTPGARHYVPIGWDEALELVADELRALAHPDEAIFYTSGRTSNEAAFLYQLFARRFGTNNLPDCSNMCHESSGTGLAETLGSGKGTVQLADFEQADAIFVIGQNPGTNHPRMLTTLRAAKQRGCRIVAINPLREAGLLRFRHPQKLGDVLGHGVDIADLYLQVRVGGDIALLKGVMKAMLDEEAHKGGVVDHAFIGAHTTGFDELAADLAATGWDEITAASGVTRAEIEAAAAIAARSERTICCWAMGITQHRFGVANVQAIVNLLLLRGNVGRPGTGACPVRGHSNVQGDRTMGICERPPPWLDGLARLVGFDPPRRAGLDTVGAIRALGEGRAHVLFALGGNLLSAAPDTETTAAALRRCRLTAHVSTKLNRAHLVHGARALILPCLGRTERDLQGGRPQFVTVEDSMSVVHRSQGALAPASPHLRSEPAIVAGLARATLGVDWSDLVADYDKIRDLIARVVPGFEDMNRRVRTPDGFVLPNPARVRAFAGPGGAARFTVHPIPRLDVGPGELVLTTIRAHDQFNTTVYTPNDRYRGVHGHRRVVLMNRDDMTERGLVEGQRVTLTSRHGAATRRAPGFVVVGYDVPRGSAASYFPEANVLVHLDSHAEKSRTPASKSVIIRVEGDEGSA
jgi:molybdopterin-dependent oxidoreductase alpha subunit